MLTIYTLKDAKGAKHYYEQENYYELGTPDAVGGSFWIGKGAELLGLSGKVNMERFGELLKGKVSEQVQLGRVQDGETVHRAGYDLTFAASKSASLLAFLPDGDKLIIEDFKASVKTAFGYLQRYAADVRIKVDGEIRRITLDNLIAAAFLHDLSRARDPHLHIHIVLMNMVQLENGEWRSLSSEKVYQLKMVLGAICRDDFSRRLQMRGYETLQTSLDGLFEIVGISRAQIEHFSTRHLDIAEVMQGKGLDEYVDSKHIMDITRAKYRNLEALSRDELYQSWLQSAKDAGLTTDALVHEAKARGNHYQPAKGQEVQQAVEYAIALLSERKAAFSIHDVVRWSITKNIGHVSLAQADAQIQHYLAQGRLLETKIPDLLTTPEMVALENANIASMKRNKGVLKPLYSQNEIKSLLEDKNLTKGQQAAIQFLLTTKDAIVGVQGLAGVGKTTMQQHVLSALKAQAIMFDVIGLAPSGKAAMMLQSSIKEPCQTIDSFIIDVSQGVKTFEKPCYIVVDEASMLSSRNAKRLFDVFGTLPNGSRLVLQGDYLQLQSVAAGNPFLQLMAKGMAHVQMMDIVRQNDATLKQAVTHAILKDVDKVMETLQGKVHEINDRDERLQTMSEDYLSRTPHIREHTLLMTTSNEDRRELSRMVREGLKAEGLIAKEGITTPILVSKNLEQAQARNIHAYEIGDVVRVGRHQAGLEANQYYHVVGIDPDNAQLKLKTRSSYTLTLSPSALRYHDAIEIYRQEMRELCVGDVIRWRRTIDKALGLINAQTLQVTAVEETYATLKLPNGEALVLDLREHQHQHYDDAHVGTANALQGDTKFNVVGMINAGQTALTNIHALYVILSRATQESRLYVDDLEAVKLAINHFNQEKVSALEALHAENYSKKLFDVIQKQMDSPKNTQQETTQAHNSPLKRQKKLFWNKDVVAHALSSDVVLRLIEDKDLVDLNERPFKYRQGENLRFGKSGALSITGPLVTDYSGKTAARNIFQLYCEAKGVTYSEAINEIGQWLNITPQDAPVFEKQSTRATVRMDNTPTKDDLKNINRAQQYFNQSLPVKGTLAENYLRHHRGITTDDLPESVRFLPRRYSSLTQRYHPALISIALSQEGEVQAIQATLLDNQGGRLTCKVIDTDEKDKHANPVQKYIPVTGNMTEQKKASLEALEGPIEKHMRPLAGKLKFGASNKINEGTRPGLPILVCEGLETGLSVRDAMPEHTIIVTHGVQNFKRIEAAKDEPVLILVDNDGAHSHTQKVASDAVKILQEKGLSAAYAMPAIEGADYNDIARREGVEAVRSSIQKSLSLALQKQGPELGL